MSVDDNSTIAPSSDIDGSFQSLDEHVDIPRQEEEERGLKKARHPKRLRRPMTAVYAEHQTNNSELTQRGEGHMPAEGEGEEAIISYEKSPYANAEVVSILVGADKTPFSIHNTVLARSVVLAAKFDTSSLAKQSLSIPELDETTAHTLVHYLYTGRYQDLKPPSQTENLTTASYKAGTCVYCAAVRYQLVGLAELAKEKIRVLDESVSIAEILAIARDHAFPLLPEDETWYPVYLEDAIKYAMVTDPEPFRRPEFITKVEGNSRLLQVVWKTVMSNYASLPLPKKEHNENVPSAPEAVIDDVNDVDGEERHETGEKPSMGATKESMKENSAADALPSYQTEPKLSVANDAFENTLKLDDIEPTMDTPQAPEPFTDELGFEKSKMYQKMGKKDTETSVRSGGEGEREQVAHKRSDSVVHVEEAVTTPLEEAEEADKSGDVAPSEAIGSKKSKKSNKKKKSQIVF